MKVFCVCVISLMFLYLLYNLFSQLQLIKPFVPLSDKYEKV